jgi:hypothetical protein
VYRGLSSKLSSDWLSLIVLLYACEILPHEGQQSGSCWCYLSSSIQTPISFLPRQSLKPESLLEHSEPSAFSSSASLQRAFAAFSDGSLSQQQLVSLSPQLLFAFLMSSIPSSIHCFWLARLFFVS